MLACHVTSSSHKRWFDAEDEVDLAEITRQLKLQGTRWCLLYFKRHVRDFQMMLPLTAVLQAAPELQYLQGVVDAVILQLAAAVNFPQLQFLQRQWRRHEHARWQRDCLRSGGAGRPHGCCAGPC